MSKGRVLNISFAHLTTEHLDLLSRNGLIHNREVGDKRTLLPIISEDMPPEAVRELVTETVEKEKITSDDLIIVSGTPDVTFYTLVAIRSRVKENPMVLFTIGRKGPNGFKVTGFRQILLEADGKPGVLIVT